MGFIPQITCRHCGNKFSGLHNRCPHCGTRRVKQASRPTSSTAAAAPGSAAAAREEVNTKVQFIFGCVLVVAVIAAVIILINANLGGGTAGSKNVEICGSITWNDAASPSRPGSVTVNLLANGTQVDSKAVTASEDGIWSYDFGKKARLDSDKNEIRYTLSVSSIDGYTATSSGYNLTLSYVEPTPTPEPTPEPTPTPVINTILVYFGTSQLDQFAMNPGDTIPLSAVTYPMDVQCTVSWRSTDESICTVDENGVVTGVSAGWGSVIAYVGDVEKEVLVLVRRG